MDLYRWANGSLSLALPVNPDWDRVSADGSRIAFSTTASLVPEDTDGQTDVYEESNGQATLVSAEPSGVAPFGQVFVGSQSEDGSLVTFSVFDGTNFVQYARRDGQVALVPPIPAGNRGCGNTQEVANGDTLFSTDAALSSDDTDSSIDVYFVHGSEYTRLSPGNGPHDACFIAVSDDGSQVAFTTDEALVPEDTDNATSLYVSHPIPGDSSGGPVSAGGTVSTGSTPTAADPLETSVHSPSAGTVTIDEQDATGAAPTGFELLGMQAVIHVSVSPAPTSASPLSITFDLDGSLLADAGVDADHVVVFKDGVQVAACTATSPAAPDPCVSHRTALSGGGAEITILTSTASTWTFAKHVGSSDTTPPTITPTLGGTLGNDGWYRSDVSVSWTVADPDSDVTSKTGCDPSTLSADSTGTVYTCQAESAGGSNSQSVTVKRDATKPSVSFGSHPSSYTVDQSVTISCSASDATSGIATNCQGVSAPAYTFQVGQNTVGTSATDHAGNSNSASTSFTVQVTPTSLCSLTNQFVHGSSKYQALTAAQKRTVDALATSACNAVTSITAKQNAKQKASFVAAYQKAVQSLLGGGWLTSSQASTLGVLVTKL